jgi:hypothetical protein
MNSVHIRQPLLLLFLEHSIGYRPSVREIKLPERMCVCVTQHCFHYLVLFISLFAASFDSHNYVVSAGGQINDILFYSIPLYYIIFYSIILYSIIF